MSGSRNGAELACVESDVLPLRARTRSGIDFSPREEIWAFRDGVTGVHINFESLIPLVSTQMLVSFKLALIWLFQNRASGTCIAVYSTFLHFLRSMPTTEMPLAEVSSIDIINYRAQLSGPQINRLRTLSGLLRRWHSMKIVGVNDDVILLLESLRLKSHPAGEAVRTMCPIDGPLSQIEDESFQDGLNAAYAMGTLRDDEFFATWITRALGHRPCQSAALKVCDLVVVTHEDQSVEYTIRIPRAKQRDRIHPRESFKVRPLISQIGATLNDYVQRVRVQFSATLDDPSEAPMFPRSDPVGSPGYEYHRTGNEMSSLIVKSINKLQAWSERTGAPLHVFPTRLRRTVGTRAAQEGHSELVIAEILDHSNIASAAYYVEAVPEIAARIDAAVAKTLGPIALAFQGIAPDCVASESDPLHGQIIDLRIDQTGASMGGCHGNGNCSFAAPVACYTCRSFKPWIDGPHLAVLEHLLGRRERQLESGDQRIASVNDRSILAVAEVINLCAQQLEGDAS
jgi:hypothetical protein